jgi:hypothetical protein
MSLKNLHAAIAVTSRHAKCFKTRLSYAHQKCPFGLIHNKDGACEEETDEMQPGLRPESTQSASDPPTLPPAFSA